MLQTLWSLFTAHAHMNKPTQEEAVTRVQIAEAAKDNEKASVRLKATLRRLEAEPGDGPLDILQRH